MPASSCKLRLHSLEKYVLDDAKVRIFFVIAKFFDGKILRRSIFGVVLRLKIELILVLFSV